MCLQLRTRRTTRRFITAISFIPNPSLYPRPPLAPWGAAALGAVAVFQWLVSGRNYAKYSEEGANPVAILKVRYAPGRQTSFHGKMLCLLMVKAHLSSDSKPVPRCQGLGLLCACPC